MPEIAGRTQQIPSARRSVGAELTGEVTSILGIWCSHLPVVIFTGMNFFVEEFLLVTSLKT